MFFKLIVVYRVSANSLFTLNGNEGFTDFKQECVTSWTRLFAKNEVQFTDNAIDNFLAFVDYMSCSADTYVSLGGSNGCADQLTNWDGTQKVGLGIFYKEKKKSQSR